MSAAAAGSGTHRRGTLTVAILTRDEEANFPRCQASVAGLAEQIVVVDSGSSDRTVEIARAAKLDHACIVGDGAKLSYGITERFNHQDLAQLERKMEKHAATPGKMVMVDGVYSMEGDIADLPGLVALCRRYGAALGVDDAHALGVLGPKGDGTAAHFGLQAEVDIIAGTFSKSLASVGGFLAGSERVINYLRHNSRPFIFTAALPPANTAGVLAALEVLQQEPERRDRLWHNARKSGPDISTLVLLKELVNFAGTFNRFSPDIKFTDEIITLVAYSLVIRFNKKESYDDIQVLLRECHNQFKVDELESALEGEFPSQNGWEMEFFWEQLVQPLIEINEIIAASQKNQLVTLDVLAALESPVSLKPVNSGYSQLSPYQYPYGMLRKRNDENNIIINVDNFTQGAVQLSPLSEFSTSEIYQVDKSTTYFSLTWGVIAILAIILLSVVFSFSFLH